MRVDWSFSANRCFRRCQQQFFLREIAASHNARDSFRRECFLLKQVKTPEQWRGLVIHRGIELFVVPPLQGGTAIDWDAAVRGTIDLARRQVAFSRERRYREPGMTKTEGGDDYCALLPHALGEELPANVLPDTEAVIETALRNLAGLDELWRELRGRRRYFSEHRIRVSYDGASLVAQLDLLSFRGYGKPIIVDWKVSDSMGGSDAHLQTAFYAWAIWHAGTWGSSGPRTLTCSRCSYSPRLWSGTAATRTPWWSLRTGSTATWKRFARSAKAVVTRTWTRPTLTSRETRTPAPSARFAACA
jgi:hypothetical protein